MRLNGKETELKEPTCLKELLIARGYNISRVAAELNGEIVPKASYGEVTVSEGDSLEVVAFVGGG